MAKPEDPQRILIIDRDRTVSDKIVSQLRASGVRLECVLSVERGISMLRETVFEAVLIRGEIDGGLNGETMAAFQTEKGSPELVVFTNSRDPKQAEKAIRLGVWEYVIDSSPEKVLPDIVKRLLLYRKHKATEPTEERGEIRAELEKTGIIGRSDIMQMCIDQAIVIGQSEANVLIYGESGTGKELFAKAIHELSPRAGRPLTIVDCAALPPSLIESILFGHLKGSFTGADKAQRGLVEQADGGTLFLDEIGEIPPAMQKKLLRVIQEHTYLPVGSTTERASDFRLIAATNRNLQALVDKGDFREDLFYRLKTFYLELPPLRRRIPDITELAYYYRDLFCRQQHLKRKKFSPDYLLLLSQYDWPGNVRELFQAIERSISEAQESDTLHPIHLPPGIRIHAVQKRLADNGQEIDIAAAGGFEEAVPVEDFPSLKSAREEAVRQCEKHYLDRLLSQTDGDIKKCCSIAGLSRSRLYDLLKKYNLVKR
jgi:two-component system NtrC family response regulator